MYKKEIGKIGEQIAAKYLKDNGYKIKEVNFYCRYGEIDIVAFNQNKIVFVEVKTRTSLKYGYPVEAINKKKIMNMKKTAVNYLCINKIYNLEIRFDAIEVYLGKDKYKINHIKDIID